MNARRFDHLDRVIGEIDKIIKTLSVPPRASRDIPDAPSADALGEADRLESARLMRVNHSGEVAAQALYQGQALTARDPKVKSAMDQAAAEEIDHLAWCEQRLRELKGKTSLLNPLWYFGSLSIGAFAGALGDHASLGFIAETEKQVESHLRDHLGRLSAKDSRSRAILEQMTHDEVQHGAKAASMGGKALPFPIIWAMRATSKLMTRGSYWI
ncbi:MAG TPA: 2-polyprenyl-3-methyl-6-methoxy-1,4-benzoquinone monooxygenase [Steroidobacteraceae bacterium]|nr:2-polyprenyl-3-methyl-6-methoxy-1,4-benzoquinone monooxygenase [Steroidobacteraceae bacterium]